MSSPVETDRPEQTSDRSVIASRVADCANRSNRQAEFLQHIGNELAQAFPAGVVAIASGEWSSPMMLVVDAQLGNDVDRSMVRHLLDSAAVVPVACDVPLQETEAGVASKTRGLHIEICDKPTRAALLMVYPQQAVPAPIEQVNDLKLLSVYVKEIRDQIATLPAMEENRAMIAPEQSGDRQSLQLFHQDLDTKATSYRIANETRRLLNADRVTVLLPKHNRFRVSSISGVAVVDTRSNAVKCIEELTDRAAIMSRPLALPGNEPLPPQIQRPMDDYLDITGVSDALLLPLHAPDPSEDQIDSISLMPFEGTGEIVGVIVLEYFSGNPPKQVNNAINTVATEAVLALRNSKEHQRIFGLGLWKALGSVSQALRSPLICASILAAISLIAAGLLVQIDHQVIATGTAVPVNQRQVFASNDGVVKEILVADGQQVSAGDPLIQLENAELEAQAESLSGEIIAAQKRISSIQAVRLNPSGEPSQAERLILEERQLQSDLANLQAQSELVRKQQDELTIKSPIDGIVVAWQIDRRLASRPISRGNLLMSVAQHDGPWTLRMKVPDESAGPLLDSLKEFDNLPVRFAVATVPGDSFDATLNSVATSTRLDESGQHVIDVFASIDSPVLEENETKFFSPQDTKVGADVTAKIACGKRSVIHSWFSDVFDFVDRNVMFYFR